MPEWGHLPIPAKLLKAGVKDMLRLSDARISGTSFGTIVVHISPEAAMGGALAIVKDGDEICPLTMMSSVSPGLPSMRSCAPGGTRFAV